MTLSLKKSLTLKLTSQISKGNYVNAVEDTNAKGEKIWVVDEDSKDKPKTDKDWNLDTASDKFVNVTKPEITNGLIAGDWKQISAEKNSDFGPKVDGLSVPEETLHAGDFKDKDSEEYTLYYVMPADYKDDTKTVERTVHYVTLNTDKDGKHTELMPSTKETVTYSQNYNYVTIPDGSKKFVNTTTVKDADGKNITIWDRTSTEPINDDSWKLDTKADKFANVTKPEITNDESELKGFGTWTQVDASQDSKYGPKLDRLNVQGEDLSTADKVNNNENEEYTLYYVVPAEAHKDSKTVTRTVHFKIDGTDTDLAPSTDESVTFSQDYTTANGKNVNTTTVTDSKGNKHLVVDIYNPTKDAKDASWKVTAGDANFIEVDRPSITNGEDSKYPQGNWERVDKTVRNSEAGPDVENNTIVPKDEVSDTVANGTHQEYTIYYAMPAHHISQTRTLKRIVNFVTLDGNDKLLTPTTEEVTYKQDYFYIDGKDGKKQFVNGKILPDGSAVVDSTVNTTPKDDTWTLVGTNDNFNQVVKNQISNGFLPGDWKQVDATQDSKVGPELNNDSVEAEKNISADKFNDGEKQVYTLYYVRPATDHFKTVNRIVNFKVYGTNQELLDPTREEVTYYQNYGVEDSTGKFVNTKTVTDHKGRKHTIVDIHNENEPKDDTWHLVGTNDKFEVVNKPEIKNGEGKLPGDWYRVFDTTVKNSEFGPNVENDIVPEDIKNSDMINGQNQEYTIFYTNNATEPVEEKAYAVHDIDYKYGNGPHKGEKASNDVTENTITYIRKGTKNTVTGKTTWGEWTPDKSFVDTKSPEIKDYTPDKSEVKAPKVDTSKLKPGEVIKLYDHVLYYTQENQPIQLKRHTSGQLSTRLKMVRNLFLMNMIQRTSRLPKNLMGILVHTSIRN